MKSPPPLILTLTGNLLAETTLNFGAWMPGATQRAFSASFQAGGKGINVVRMLRRLGAPAQALCFAGGTTGLQCTDWLTTHAIPFRAFPASSPTRMGVVIRSSTAPETTFFSPDAAPGAKAVAECARHLDELPDGLALAVCGSLPGWQEPCFDPLRESLVRWLRRGVLVADTYGPPLAWFAGQAVYLLKINRTELSSLASVSGGAPGPGGLPSGTKARNWVITSGAGPAFVGSEDGSAMEIMPPRVVEVSPTGSGDVLLACLLEAWLRRGLSLQAAVRFALPHAAANAAHPGVAEHDPASLPPMHA